MNALNVKTAMNAEILVFVICVEAIIYLLLYNFSDSFYKYYIKTIPTRTFSNLSNFHGVVRGVHCSDINASTYLTA